MLVFVSVFVCERKGLYVNASTHISPHKVLLALSDGLQSCVCVYNYYHCIVMWTLELPQGQVQHHYVSLRLKNTPVHSAFTFPGTHVDQCIPTHTFPVYNLIIKVYISVIVTKQMLPVSLKHLGCLSKLYLNVVSAHHVISCSVFSFQHHLFAEHTG